MIKFQNLFAVASILTIAACAPTTMAPQGTSSEVAAERIRQAEFTLREQHRRDTRVQQVAWPLLTANADLCGNDVSQRVGFDDENIWDQTREYRSTARSLWGMGDESQITQVLEGSPAEAAGLQVGDVLVAFDGQSLSKGRNATARNYRLWSRNFDDGHMRVQYRRNGLVETVEVTGQRACSYPIILQHTDEINAYADGNNVVITMGMLRFTESDQELALVLGHEIAHNAKGHLDAQRMNRLAGGAAGLAIDVLFALGGVNTNGAFTNAGADVGSIVYSAEFEREADYVAMYFLSRAGYKTDGAEMFWRRMGAENPRSVVAARTHPSTPERFLSIAATHEEIEVKQADGAALVPNAR